jgi:multiple sugar transport system ATP-binding protein
MRNGVLQQVAHPQELYERPANLFVAEFIGSPAMNLVEATLARVDGGRLVARFGEHELVVPRADLAGRTGSRVILGIRPEDLEDAFLAGGARAGATLSVVPAIREEMGSEVFVHFSLGVPRVDRAEVLEAVDPGEPAEARQGARSAIPFVGRLGRTTAAREGESIEVAVAIERLYFFDPETGAGLHAER